MIIINPLQEIIPNLRMLGTTEYPVFAFSDGGESVLFEASLSAVGPLIARQAKTIAFDQNSVGQIVITHAHPDHVMGVPALRSLFPKASVLASATAAKTLAVEKAVSFFCKMDQALGAALRARGSLTDADQSQEPSGMKIAVDRTIQEGDTIAVGGARFTVLETPGHSDCSLSFQEKDKGILIISDATGYYLPKQNWWWPNYFTGYGAYLGSIKRLAGLGAEVLCLSHNAVIKGAVQVEAYFRDVLSATESYHQRIMRETTSGKTAQAIAEALGLEVHAKTPLLPLDFFQKNCALLVKQSLKHEGLSAE